MQIKTIFHISLVLMLSLFLLSCSNNDVKTTVTDIITTTPIKNENIAQSSEITAFEKQLEKDSLNISIRLNLADLLYSAKDFEKAVYHYSIINKIDNKNIHSLINLGNIYYDTQQNEKAIEYYEKALVLDSKNINVRCDMATCYLNLKQAEKAMEILKENILMNYNHIQSHYNLSIVYKHLGKIKEADEELQIVNKLKSR